MTNLNTFTPGVNTNFSTEVNSNCNALSLRSKSFFDLTNTLITDANSLVDPVDETDVITDTTKTLQIISSNEPDEALSTKLNNNFGMAYERLTSYGTASTDLSSTVNVALNDAGFAQFAEGFTPTTLPHSFTSGVDLAFSTKLNSNTTTYTGMDSDTSTLFDMAYGIDLVKSTPISTSGFKNDSSVPGTTDYSDTTFSWASLLTDFQSLAFVSHNMGSSDDIRVGYFTTNSFVLRDVSLTSEGPVVGDILTTLNSSNYPSTTVPQDNASTIAWSGGQTPSGNFILIRWIRGYTAKYIETVHVSSTIFNSDGDVIDTTATSEVTRYFLDSDGYGGDTTTFISPKTNFYESETNSVHAGIPIRIYHSRNTIYNKRREFRWEMLFFSYNESTKASSDANSSINRMDSDRYGPFQEDSFFYNGKVYTVLGLTVRFDDGSRDMKLSYDSWQLSTRARTALVDLSQTNWDRGVTALYRNLNTVTLSARYRDTDGDDNGSLYTYIGEAQVLAQVYNNSASDYYPNHYPTGVGTDVTYTLSGNITSAKQLHADGTNANIVQPPDIVTPNCKWYQTDVSGNIKLFDWNDTNLLCYYIGGTVSYNIALSEGNMTEAITHLSVFTNSYWDINPTAEFTFTDATNSTTINEDTWSPIGFTPENLDVIVSYNVAINTSVSPYNAILYYNDI